MSRAHGRAVLLRCWLPLLACCGVIVGWSSLSQPPLSVPSLGLLPGDKVAHLLEYAVLGVLAVRVFAHGMAGLYTTAEAVIASLLFALLFGSLDEVHQYSVPGRSVEWADLFADLLGSGGAIVVYYALRLRRRRPHSGAGPATEEPAPCG